MIDEAHRLRNVYKPSNVIARTLKNALQGCPKVLLTATPLQNSLLELFGLISFIDEQAFGDLKSFREQFANLSHDGTFEALKKRLAPLCHRTLRRQVTQYVPYTARHAIIEEFTPGESEDQLYHLVSDYLGRDDLFALPPAQRTLMTLVLRKLLASSTFAIAGALETMARRLKRDLADQNQISLEDELDQDYEALDETADEWTEDSPVEPLSQNDRAALTSEIEELESFAELAVSITNNAKGQALLRALRVAFDKTHDLGAAGIAINAADQRVYELLAEKFNLFEGVFGASDEVLGAIGSGVDFEKRIATIYQRCRQAGDIKVAFDELQFELSFEINEAMTTTRKKLLEHFDDEVREKLRIRDEDSKAILGQFERQLIRLSRHELNGHADFQSEGSFQLLSPQNRPPP